jgi:hypothetical protein
MRIRAFCRGDSSCRPLARARSDARREVVLCVAVGQFSLYDPSHVNPRLERIMESTQTALSWDLGCGCVIAARLNLGSNGSGV